MDIPRADFFALMWVRHKLTIFERAYIKISCNCPPGKWRLTVSSFSRLFDACFSCGTSAMSQNHTLLRIPCLGTTLHKYYLEALGQLFVFPPVLLSFFLRACRFPCFFLEVGQSPFQNVQFGEESQKFLLVWFGVWVYFEIEGMLTARTAWVLCKFKRRRGDVLKLHLGRLNQKYSAW